MAIVKDLKRQPARSLPLYNAEGGPLEWWENAIFLDYASDAEAALETFEYIYDRQLADEAEGDDEPEFDPDDF